MKVEFSLHVFENSIRFNENPSDASRVFPCGRIDGQMDKHDEANSFFSEICEHALRLRHLRHVESYLMLTKNKMDHSHIQWYLGYRVTVLTDFSANEDFFAVFGLG